MLVYANHFSCQGRGAEAAIFRAIRGWFKEQLGFTLFPNQVRRSGEYRGKRGQMPSWLRVFATDEDEPAIYSWVLKNLDDQASGRQWITELGLKRSESGVDFSCVVKTDEQSTLAAARSPVMASRPRVVGYIARNVENAEDAWFSPSVNGVEPKLIGEDADSYSILREEIECAERDYVLVLVSPTTQGNYLLDDTYLQERLLGLGQVVRIGSDFNSYEMESVLGRQWSAWSGAVNALYSARRDGVVRSRLFRSEEITTWGETQNERSAHLLGWVTHDTNIARFRRRVRPEGVMRLAQRRRMQSLLERSNQMNAKQLQEVISEGKQHTEEQDKYLDELAEENSQLTTQVVNLEESLREHEGQLAQKDFELRSLKGQVANQGRLSGVVRDAPAEGLMELICENKPPYPAECLNYIGQVYGDKCVVLETAMRSAEKSIRFGLGRELLSLLKKLVTEFRSKLIEGGDSQAKDVFGRNEYASRESDTVMNNRAMRDLRSFIYRGEKVEMFRHLKIGVDDDITKTIRVHFHWDSSTKQIIIGYCGKHLPVSSRS